MASPGLKPSEIVDMNDWRWPFLTIDVELTSICAQNCLFCPRDKLTRPAGFMNLQLLDRILAQAAAVGSRITFCGMGNPLLHPQFFEAGRLCRRHGVNYGLTIQVPALNDETLRLITDFEPYFIELSCSGIDQQSFERIYPRGNLNSGLHNIEKLITLRGSSRGVTVVSVVDGGQTHTKREVEDFWNSRGLNCRVFNCHSRGGNLVDKALATTCPAKITRCGLFATHSFVTWQGKLLVCCHDLRGECEIADLNQILLEEAGKKKQQILNNDMPWQICSTCDEPAARRPLPDRPFPESEKARQRYLKKSAQQDL